MTFLFKPIKIISRILLHVKWSNFCNIKYNFAKFLRTLGYDLKIASAKFQGNRFIIDEEIDEKHALQNYQNECDPGYSE